MADVAAALIGSRPIDTVATGVRPGEKIHEILVSEEEAHRTTERGDYYVIQPILPELQSSDHGAFLENEYSSADGVMSMDQLMSVLRRNHLMLDDDLVPNEEDELLA